MTTLVIKTSKDVNGNPDDSRSQAAEAGEVPKEVTLAQRLQAVVDAKLVASLNAWSESAGLSRTLLSTYVRRVLIDRERDIGILTLSKLADTAGVTRRWLAAGTTLSPELANAHEVHRLAVDQVEAIRSEATEARGHVASLLKLVDVILGTKPDAAAKPADNARAFTEAVATSDVRSDGEGLALEAARCLFAAGRIDTKRGWSSVIDALAAHELAAGTVDADPRIVAAIGRGRPRREHESQSDLPLVEEKRSEPVRLKTKKVQRGKK